MSDFAQFYQQGGVFMHAVTVLSLAGASVLAVRAVKLRSQPSRSAEQSPGLVRGLLACTLMCGVLGATFGFIEICAALLSAPPERQLTGALRAVPMALAPIAWSLMLATPLTLARAILGAAARPPRPRPAEA